MSNQEGTHSFCRTFSSDSKASDCNRTTPKLGGPRTLTTELLESFDARSIPFTSAAIASNVPAAKLDSSIQTLTPLTYLAYILPYWCPCGIANHVRPEQAATGDFLSSIASRLDRIEALILDQNGPLNQNGPTGPATSYAASSPSALTATGSGSSSYSTSSSPGIVAVATAQPTPARNTRIRRIGLSMYAMSQLNDHEAHRLLRCSSMRWSEASVFIRLVATMI